jgi:NitT/TauT family transport system substrate-binding protein
MNRSRTWVVLIVAVIGIVFGGYFLFRPNGQSGGAPGEYSGKVKVGHLVGICMSPLFYADAKGYFQEEGLDVELMYMPNPGDSTITLSGKGVQFIHNPFTNTYQAAAQGAKLKIISGSGNGGLVCIAQKDSGIRTLQGLKTKAGTGLKVGSMRINTLEMTFYRMLENMHLDYSSYEMVWFNDHFSMLAAFENKKVDVVTHVEPYATMLSDDYGGIRLGTSFDVWGEGSPDCVVSVHEDFLRDYPVTVKKYLRAILRADADIKADMPGATALLDEKKYFRVDRNILREAIPRQLPGVDLRKGVPGMELAIDDMVKLRYIEKKPENVVDLRLLEEVIAERAINPANR